jgi:hypothetical protein
MTAPTRAERRRALWSRVFVAAWAMVTCILVFCVLLLVYELYQEGRVPAVRPKRDAVASSPAIQLDNPAATQEVILYFATADGKQLAGEMGRVEFGDLTVENCRRALEALARGPRGALTPILPTTLKPETLIRGVYLLDDGELVIDLSMELEREFRRVKSASLESLMVYGIVNTLTQASLLGSGDEKRQAQVVPKKVRFLVEGSPPRESFPAHLDMSAPIAPDPRWIARAQG